MMAIDSQESRVESDTGKRQMPDGWMDGMEWNGNIGGVIGLVRHQDRQDKPDDDYRREEKSLGVDMRDLAR